MVRSPARIRFGFELWECQNLARDRLSATPVVDGCPGRWCFRTSGLSLIGATRLRAASQFAPVACPREAD